jgi:hypothetical protein
MWAFTNDDWQACLHWVQASDPEKFKKLNLIKNA